MQAGAEDARLDADLVRHGDDAALGQRGPEPAALEHGELGAADDDDRVVDEDEGLEDDQNADRERDIAAEPERGE